jgi:acyl-coenzyme A thioesterase PaaI-like protein
MLDDAAFFAVASRVRDFFILTTSFHVSFLRPVVAGMLVATGEAVRISSSVCVGASRVVDESGAELGRGQGDFCRSKKPWSTLPPGGA